MGHHASKRRAWAVRERHSRNHAEISRFGGTAMTNHLIYWFPAKRYGWSWGLPSVSQGWVVMGIFAVLLLGSAFMLLTTYSSFVFVVYPVSLWLGQVAFRWV